MNDKLIQEYINFETYNHVFNANNGAYFNPGSLLLFSNKTNNILVDNLIFQHEFAHARLNSSLYGKIIYFSKFVLLDILQFIYTKKLNPNKFIQKLNRIETLISILTENWVLTQEGFAVFTELQHLEINPLDKKGEYRQKITKFLKRESPYKNGFELVNQLFNYYSKNLHRNIIHEIGNINILNEISEFLFFKKLDINTLPDFRLSQLSNDIKNLNRTLITEYGRESFITGRESYILLKYAREVLNKHFEVISFIEIEEECILSKLINLYDSFIDDVDYSNRLKELYNLYQKRTDELCRSGGVEQILAFPSSKIIEEDDFQKIIISVDRLPDDEKQAINYYHNLNYIYYNHKNNINEFENRFKNLQSKFSTLNNIDFLIRIFPPTIIEKFKEFPQYKSIKNNYITNKYIIMNKLNIICSKEQGDLLNELFKQQSQSSSITIEEVKNKESYGHWLEYTNVAITIIASSITIIDTVIKWFKKVKENKEEQVNITINQINYNSLEIGKLEEKLNELKEKLNE